MRVTFCVHTSLFGLLVIALLSGRSAQAANTPAILPNLQLTRAGTVRAVNVQGDGKLIVGGTFTSINGIPCTNLARIKLDGTVDETWQIPVDGGIIGFATNSSSLFVYGSFSKIGGLNRGGIARYDLATASIDSNWNPNPGNVSAVVASETDVFLGGSFLSAGGRARTNLAKVSATGTGAADPAWVASADASPSALCLAGTNLYVGGYFYSVGGLPRTSLARVGTGGTGPVDSAWHPQIFSGGTVNTILADGTNVYAGGNWSSPSGKSALARFSMMSTGAVDTAWSPQPAGTVLTLLKSGTNLYVGGTFTRLSGQTITNVGRIVLETAAADASWNAGADSSVYDIGPAGNSLYLGGAFSYANGFARFGVARVDAGSGAPDPNYAAQIQVPGTISALALQPNGNLLVGGTFTMAGGVIRANLARVNADGTLDASWNPAPNSSVSRFLIYSNDVFVAGSFSTIGGLSRNVLAKVSLVGTGAVDAAWNASIPKDVNSRVNSMAASGTQLFVAGYFQTIGGQPINYLAKLSAVGTGAADPNWSPVVEVGLGWYGVESLALVGNALFAAGTFTQIGNLSRSHIAKLEPATGTVDPTWDPAPLNGYAEQLATDGTNLFVGGNFTTIGRQARTYLAQLSTSGAGDADPVWNPNLSMYPTAFAVIGTNLYVGDSYHSVARVSTLGSGARNASFAAYPIAALAVNSSGIYLGGSFTAAEAVPRNGLACFRDVAAAPFFRGSRMTSNGFRCDIALEPFQIWKIQCSTDLLTWSDWTNLSSRTPLATLQTSNVMSPGRCFYRVRTP